MNTKLLVVCFMIVGAFLFFNSCEDDDKCPTIPTNPADMPYNVSIDPADFEDSNFTGNTYFPLKSGITMVYEGENEDGELVDHEGSWEAGVDGALPGIIMFAEPIPGVWNRQEYYKGEAEDVGQVLSLTETVTVPHGTYNNCLQTAEWNLLEPGIVEHKYYAPDIGMIRAVAVKGESGYEDLIEIIQE